MNRFKTFAAAAILLAGAGVAMAQEDLTRNLSVEQTTAYNAVTGKPGSLKVTGWVDRKDLTYIKGETVKIFVKPNQQAYITVFNIGPGGQVTQLFPNAFQKENLVKANQQIEIAPAKSGAAIKVSGETGAEVIKIFASSKPVQFVPASELTAGTAFFVVKGSVTDFVRNLEVAATAPAADAIAVHNMIIKTAASR